MPTPCREGRPAGGQRGPVLGGHTAHGRVWAIHGGRWAGRHQYVGKETSRVGAPLGLCPPPPPPSLLLQPGLCLSRAEPTWRGGSGRGLGMGSGVWGLGSEPGWRRGLRSSSSSRGSVTRQGPPCVTPGAGSAPPSGHPFLRTNSLPSSSRAGDFLLCSDFFFFFGFCLKLIPQH